jgi:hypothetical protein
MRKADTRPRSGGGLDHSPAMMTPRRHTDSGPLDLLIVTSLAGAVALMACTCLMRIAGVTAPRLGDIVAFDAAKRDPASTVAQVDAAPVGTTSGGTCQLDAATMLRSGGSLLVEARHPKQTREYQVHWAGTRTSPGTRDCGASADLLLSRGDLGALSVAAGGFFSAETDPDWRPTRRMNDGPYQPE